MHSYQPLDLIVLWATACYCFFRQKEASHCVRAGRWQVDCFKETLQGKELEETTPHRGTLQHGLHCGVSTTGCTQLLFLCCLKSPHASVHLRLERKAWKCIKTKGKVRFVAQKQFLRNWWSGVHEKMRKWWNGVHEKMMKWNSWENDEVEFMKKWWYILFHRHWRCTVKDLTNERWHIQYFHVKTAHSWPPLL